MQIRKCFLILLLLLFPSCSAFNYVLTEYKGVPGHNMGMHDSKEDPWFFVQDRPEKSRLLIQGYSIIEMEFDRAAKKYLLGSGRSCRITDRHRIHDAAWEITYECENAN